MHTATRSRRRPERVQGERLLDDRRGGLGHARHPDRHPRPADDRGRQPVQGLRPGQSHAHRHRQRHPQRRRRHRQLHDRRHPVQRRPGRRLRDRVRGPQRRQGGRYSATVDGASVTPGVSDRDSRPLDGRRGRPDPGSTARSTHGDRPVSASSTATTSRIVYGTTAAQFSDAGPAATRSRRRASPGRRRPTTRSASPGPRSRPAPSPSSRHPGDRGRTTDQGLRPGQSRPDRDRRRRAQQRRRRGRAMRRRRPRQATSSNGGYPITFAGLRARRRATTASRARCPAA